MSADRSWQLQDFAPGAAAARLHRPSRVLTFALLLVLILAGSGILWAALAHIEEVARAPGRVVPSGRARIVESLDGGIVREIHVAEGSKVTRGDILVRIDDTTSSSSLGELQAQRNALVARSLMLESEARGAEELDFGLTGLDPASALALREAALLASRRAAYMGQRAVLQAQVDQATQEISKLQSAIERNAEGLALLNEEIDLKTSSGVVPRAQMLPLERERSGLLQARDGQTVALVQARAALREGEARLEEAALNRRAEVTAERAEIRNQLEIIDESIRRATDAVARANLRAPVDGIVTELNVNTVDEVIKPDEEVLRIVPADDMLQVEARLRPEDVAFVRPGLAARIKLTSFDFTIYGALDGTVARIGADAMTDEASGEIYFPVIVETATSTLSRGDQTLEIKPGMVASVDILTGERTLLDYLLKPLRKARAEALRER
ncbi:HlyD family type I secretion periplasmic adaptor subunit [Salipiger sp. PrR003]|uniref:HlyD family type I secretion periplasmic adaptor subunit n=1 Tax=Salipiger sp. PrR003 TaxID=2706776 RepID=UPI0013DB671B|nr:HlyD family type I secretion periplasmic adaptor subunit [Salipiger sp. PrR003]NDV53335.1 HlyD family type I secretion periplasmic adaptor subunit [Salipiger sp. PrR003]